MADEEAETTSSPEVQQTTSSAPDKLEYQDLLGKLADFFVEATTAQLDEGSSAIASEVPVVAQASEAPPPAKAAASALPKRRGRGPMAAEDLALETEPKRPRRKPPEPLAAPPQAAEGNGVEAGSDALPRTLPEKSAELPETSPSDQKRKESESKAEKVQPSKLLKQEKPVEEKPPEPEVKASPSQPSKPVKPKTKSKPTPAMAFLAFKPTQVVTKMREAKQQQEEAQKEAPQEKEERQAEEDGANSSKGEGVASAKAKGIATLGNIAEMQKKLDDDRKKLRMWVIKAKQEWEERQEQKGQARGETNDKEYYIASIGEVFGPGNDFRAEESIGRGVFSSVFRCKNVKEGTDYAIKFVRSNIMMRKAAEKEVETYRRLAKLVPKEDQEASQFIMFLSPPETFLHHGHLCMVFELLKCDLRTALSKYGQGRGLPLQTVAQYSRQIFLALRVLRKLKLIHGDLKPDNVLMSLSKTEVKVCDFGMAMDTSEEISTAEFQPRYYRAPEVIIGNPFDTQIDLWSAGVTLFELATGKILFTGRNNNSMLRQMLEVCGTMSKRMATTGAFSEQHFTKDGDFKQKDPDSITGLPEVVPMKRYTKPKRPLSTMLEKIKKEPPPNSDTRTQERLFPRLVDLVIKCLRLDPAERFTPEHALDHAFYKKDR